MPRRGVAPRRRPTRGYAGHSSSVSDADVLSAQTPRGLSRSYAPCPRRDQCLGSCKGCRTHHECKLCRETRFAPAAGASHDPGAHTAPRQRHAVRHAPHVPPLGSIPPEPRAYSSARRDAHQVCRCPYRKHWCRPSHAPRQPSKRFA